MQEYDTLWSGNLSLLDYNANTGIKVVNGDVSFVEKLRICLETHYPEIRIRETTEIDEICFNEHYQNLVSNSIFLFINIFLWKWNSLLLIIVKGCMYTNTIQPTWSPSFWTFFKVRNQRLPLTVVKKLSNVVIKVSNIKQRVFQNPRALPPLYSCPSNKARSNNWFIETCIWIHQIVPRCPLLTEGENLSVHFITLWINQSLDRIKNSLSLRFVPKLIHKDSFAFGSYCASTETAENHKNLSKSKRTVKYLFTVFYAYNKKSLF